MIESVKELDKRGPINSTLEKRNPIRNDYMWASWNHFPEEVKAGNYLDQDFLKFLAGGDVPLRAG